VSLLVVGVGALQILLDKGQEDDWFGSNFIVTLTVLAALGLIGLVLWEWNYKRPIVDVPLFGNLNFLGASGMMFILGVMLFSTLVMMPLYLQTLMGYTAETAGLVLSGGGVLLLVLMPMVGGLTTKVQARFIVAFGWFALALGMYYSTQQMDLEISFKSASIVRLAQVFGLGFLFVPINLASYVGVPAEKTNSVAGLVNFMRNIGSSVGTSMVTTLLARRAQVHQVYLSAHVTPGGQRYLGGAHALTSRLAASGADGALAARQALGFVYASVVRQATLLAYLDTYAVLSVVAAIMCVLSFGLKKNQLGGGRVVLE